MIASRSSRRLAACGIAFLTFWGTARAASEPPHSAELDAMIVRAAKAHGVPEHLVRRIVMRESGYNPTARNHSFWGLMQISYPTAKSMGFRGTPEQLLNPLTNLTYAVPYLANAFIIAGKQEDAAVRLYASGYYASAKSRGLLGALRTAESAPMAGGASFAEPAPIVTASYQAAQPRDTTPQFEQTQAQSVVRAASAHGGDDGAEGVDMHTNRRGKIELPRRWLHDGGTTIIARGEQAVETIAAFRADQAGVAAAKPSRGRKNTTFAALEAPPANAQAYAADAAPQSSQLTQTPSQAAIAQATAAPAEAPVTTQASSDDARPRRHRRRTARRSRHRPEAADETVASDQAPQQPTQ